MRALPILVLHYLNRHLVPAPEQRAVAPHPLAFRALRHLPIRVAVTAYMTRSVVLQPGFRTFLLRLLHVSVIVDNDLFFLLRIALGLSSRLMDVLPWSPLELFLAHLRQSGLTRPLSLFSDRQRSLLRNLAAVEGNDELTPRLILSGKFFPAELFHPI